MLCVDTTARVMEPTCFREVDTSSGRRCNHSCSGPGVFCHGAPDVGNMSSRRREFARMGPRGKCRLARAASVPHLAGVLEGRRVARGGSRGRKVRTPQGAGPRNSGQAGDTRGRSRRKAWSTDSATENKPPGSKGPGKGETAVQETTARNARSGARQTSPGARPNREPVMRPASHRRKPVGFRVSVAQRNDSLPGASREDRIRLTALPRHHPFRGGPCPGTALSPGSGGRSRRRRPTPPWPGLRSPWVPAGAGRRPRSRTTRA